MKPINWRHAGSWNVFQVPLLYDSPLTWALIKRMQRQIPLPTK